MLSGIYVFHCYRHIYISNVTPSYVYTIKTLQQASKLTWAPPGVACMHTNILAVILHAPRVHPWTTIATFVG
jgi:hypothetical protein